MDAKHEPMIKECNRAINVAIIKATECVRTLDNDDKSLPENGAELQDVEETLRNTVLHFQSLLDRVAYLNSAC